MADGRGEADWAHTATIVAKIHNANCTRKRDMITPAEISPYGRRREKEAIRKGPKLKVSDLKFLIPKKGKGPRAKGSGLKPDA